MMEDDKMFSDALMYGIIAPLIVDQRWPEVPEDLKLKAKAYRMFQSLQCVKEEMATEFDALIYLHTASLAQPFDHHWYNIYFHLFKKYFPEQASMLEKQDSYLPVELDKYEEYLLNSLRMWIYKQQINAVRERFKNDREQEQKQIEKHITLDSFIRGGERISIGIILSFLFGTWCHIPIDIPP